MRGTVRLVAGDGVVCRRSQELLYSPTGSADLIDAFRTARPGELCDAVTRLIDESDDPAADPSFAIVDWSGAVSIAVFGDVELTSDHRSLSRLSAAGAGTWIERTLRDVDEVTIGVNAADADPETDLELGIVRAGGFVVTCSDSSRSVDRETESPAGASLDTDVVDEARAVSDLVMSDGPIITESFGLINLPDPAVEQPTEDAPSLADLLDVGPPPTPAPELSWGLRFTDGSVEAVDQTLILGRKPTHRDGETDSNTRLLPLDCSQVSGRHLAVHVDGGRVAVIDLGSSNGSFVVTSGDGQLIRLEPGVPQALDVGTIVQIGTKRFTVEADE